MYGIGDKIVYPLYGAGVIEGLEECDVDGVSNLYYLMYIPTGNLKIKICAGTAATMGIRAVFEDIEVISVIKAAFHEEFKYIEDWNKRYKDNLEKIKTGDLSMVTRVFKNLYDRERIKGLSSAEKKMMSTVRTVIISEIAISHEIDKQGADKLLEDVIKEYYSGGS